MSKFHYLCTTLTSRTTIHIVHLMLQNIKKDLVDATKVRNFASPTSQVNTCNRRDFGKSPT